MTTANQKPIKPSQLVNFEQMFQQNYFVIPDYQRGFSWEIDQLRDLRKDIENVYDKSYMHFTGTIVAARKENKGNQFEIVDGQQRITSLVILLSVIFSKSPDRFQEIMPNYLKRGSVGEERIVLTPNEETRVFYEDLIHRNVNTNPRIKSHWNLRNAHKFFTEWITENDLDIQLIYKTVTQKLGFIFFSPMNNKEIGIMFEVINNRGKALSELEKIKNYFIYFSTVKGKDALRQTINDKWKEIQENLSLCKKTSNDDENRFLRYTYLVFYEPSKSNSHYVYDQLKSKYPVGSTFQEEERDKQVKEMTKYVEFLADASNYYKYLFVENAYSNTYNENEHYKRINKSLHYLRCQPALASISPLYLAVMNSFSQPIPEGVIIEKRVADLLELIEKVNFRLYILPGVFSRADTKQGDMFWFAHFFYKNPSRIDNPTTSYFTRFNESFQHQGDIYNWIEEELRQMVLRLCPISKFVEALTIDENEDYNFYNWRNSGLRYFLACYEETLKKTAKLPFNIIRILKRRDEVKENLNEYLSVEHIWASAAQPHFGELHREKRRLGNFVLMGLSANIAQNDDDIPTKVKQLTFENHIGKGSLDMHQIAELEQILKDVLNIKYMQSRRRKTNNYYKDISIFLNDIREDKLINFALKRWNVNGDRINDYVKIDSFKANVEKRNRNYYLLTDPK